MATPQKDKVHEDEGQVDEGADDTSPGKKETFQWNTPADEFAEDVGSDIDEDSEDDGEGGHAGAGDSSADQIHFSEVTNGQVDVKPRIDGLKKQRIKNQFPCPKCSKVWNWPWELRRHLVMHFKEVNK